MVSTKSSASKPKSSKSRSMNKISFMSWKYKSSKSSKSQAVSLQSGTGDSNSGEGAPTPPLRSASLPAHKLKEFDSNDVEVAPGIAATNAKASLNNDLQAGLGPEDSGHDAEAPTSMDFGMLTKQSSNRPAPKNKKTSDKVEEAAAERKFKRRSGRSFRIFRSKSSIASSYEGDGADASPSPPAGSNDRSSEKTRSTTTNAIDISDMGENVVEAKASDSLPSQGSEYVSRSDLSRRDTLDEEEEEEEWAQVAAF